MAQQPSFARQDGYRVWLEWGRRGARDAAARGDVLVVVDTLSFSTLAATAIAHGGLVYPCAPEEDRLALARRVGGEATVSRRDVPAKGRFSLSPLTYVEIEPGTRIVVTSPNGAACSQYGRLAPALFVGSLVNARAVGEAVSGMLARTDGCVTVVACGERWQTAHEEGVLRPAIEDLLGAGAILSHLAEAKSPEARTAEAAFLGLRDDLEGVLWECASGRQLREAGFAGDVRHAARLDAYTCVPAMQGERLERFEDGEVGDGTAED